MNQTIKRYEKFEMNSCVPYDDRNDLYQSNRFAMPILRISSNGFAIFSKAQTLRK